MADEFQTKLGRLRRKAQTEIGAIRRSFASAIDAEESCGDWIAVESYLTVAQEAGDRLTGWIADAVDLSRRGQAGEDNIDPDEEEDSLADAEED